MGVDTVEFLDHRDGVIEDGLDLRRDLARAIRRHRPEVLVLSNFELRWGFGGLNMADHRVVGLAALDAARDAGNRWVFPELLDEGLEPWSGLRFAAVNAAPRPTHFVDVTATLDRGIASLARAPCVPDGLGDADGSGRRSSAATRRDRRRVRACLAVEFELVTL